MAEASADCLVKIYDLCPTEEDKRNTANTVRSFVTSYVHKDKALGDEPWLDAEFAKHPKIWKDDAERQEVAHTIVDAVTRYEREKTKLADCREKGISHQSYLADTIERGAKAMGTVQLSEYAGKIDAAINQANADMARVIHTASGGINQNPNLDGNIVEQHHASTFNIDAAAKEKDFTAVAQESHGKDSVDLFIDDARGHHVRRYQSKYGKDSETTEQYFEDGDYRGQRKLVPKGQGKDIKGYSNLKLLTARTRITA